MTTFQTEYRRVTWLLTKNSVCKVLDKIVIFVFPRGFFFNLRPWA